MMSELLGKAVNHVTRWLYSRHEVTLFRALPVGPDDPAKDLEVLRFHGGVDAASLPALGPGIGRRLSQRLAMKSLRDDAVFLVMVAGCGVGFGWVRQATGIEIEEVGLTLSYHAPQICFFDFFLDPGVRRRGLYAKFLRKLRWTFRTHPVLIYSETWNVASLAGIASAGFAPLATVQGVNVCGLRITTAMRVHAPAAQGRDSPS